MGVDYTKYGFKGVEDLIPDSEKICLLLKKCFSRKYCNELLAFACDKGFKSANDKYPKTYRNNERLELDDVDLADKLFRQCKKRLPNQLKFNNRDLFLSELNSRLRYCKYSTGQKFSIHQDGVFHQDKQKISVMTFLLYLNDSDDFVGGETNFYSERYGKSLLATYRAKAGDVLVFEHDIWHSGSEVESGHKYILRSDFIYEYSISEQIEKNKQVTTAIINSDKHHQGYIWKIIKLADQLLVTASRDKSIKIWNEKLELQQRLDCHDNSVLDLSSNLNGDIFAVSRDGFMSRWKKVNGQYQLIFKVDTKHPCALSIRVLTNGNIVTTGSDNIVRLWTEKGIELASSQVTNDWQWQVLELSNEQLISCCADGYVYIWNSRNLSLIKFADLDIGTIRCFAANKNHLFVGCESGLIATVNLTNFRVIKKWQAHISAVRELLLFNGSIFSCGEDNAVCRFDIFGNEKRILYHHELFVTSLIGARNKIYSVSYDGCINSSQV